MNLCEIASSYDLKTDKYNGHTYLPHYEKLFLPFKDKQVNVLEVGVLVGESLKLWSHYFKKGTIYGMDIFCRVWDHIAESACDFETVSERLKDFDNIKLIFADCQKREEIDKQNLPQFDIIIDDGPHKPFMQLITFNNLKDRLKVGGLYIIEDVSTHTANELLEQIQDSKIFKLVEESPNDHSNNFILYERVL